MTRLVLMLAALASVPGWVRYWQGQATLTEAATGTVVAGVLTWLLAAVIGVLVDLMAPEPDPESGSGTGTPAEQEPPWGAPSPHGGSETSSTGGNPGGSFGGFGSQQ